MTNDDGRRQYPDGAFLNAIRDGAQTTQEIADAVGVTRQGADYRLRQLRDDGEVTAEKIGNTLVWSLPPQVN
jgi:predicted transcriptional regulator